MAPIDTVRSRRKKMWAFVVGSLVAGGHEELYREGVTGGHAAGRRAGMATMPA
jgi:hypothetical protein